MAETLDELSKRVDDLEEAQREDHKVLMDLVSRVEDFAKFAGVEFAELRKAQRETLEAVDGLHTGVIALATQTAKNAQANLDAVPPWLAKITLGILGAGLTAAVADLAVRLVRWLLGG